MRLQKRLLQSWLILKINFLIFSSFSLLFWLSTSCWIIIFSYERQWNVSIQWLTTISEAIDFFIIHHHRLSQIVDERDSILCNCRKQQHCAIACRQFCTSSAWTSCVWSSVATEILSASHVCQTTSFYWVLKSRTDIISADLSCDQHLLCQFQDSHCEESKHSRQSFITNQHDFNLFWISSQLCLRLVEHFIDHVSFVSRINEDHVDSS